jgi:hypothetical protein
MITKYPQMEMAHTKNFQGETRLKPLDSRRNPDTIPASCGKSRRAEGNASLTLPHINTPQNAALFSIPSRFQNNRNTDGCKHGPPRCAPGAVESCRALFIKGARGTADVFLN